MKPRGDELDAFRAYALEHAARVSAVSFSGVVFMRLLAVPIFREVPGPVQLAGSVLVIGSGVLLGSPSRRGKLGG